MMNEGSGETSKGEVDSILGDMDEEVRLNEKKIKLTVAIDYLMDLVDDDLRPVFEEAVDSAESLDDYNRILELAKRHIGQTIALKMLGLE